MKCPLLGNIEPDYVEDTTEERINLHHSLKEVLNASTKAIKDVHKYFSQKVTSVAEEQLNIIGRPLTKVIAPLLLLKDYLKKSMSRKDASHGDVSNCIGNSESEYNEGLYHPGTNPDHQKTPARSPLNREDPSRPLGTLPTDKEKLTESPNGGNSSVGHQYSSTVIEKDRGKKENVNKTSEASKGAGDEIDIRLSKQDLNRN